MSPVNVTWTHDNTKIDTETGTKYDIDDHHSLTVMNLEKDEDSGTYVCNVNGVEAAVYLDVHWAYPQIKIPPKDVEVKYGDDAIFECRFDEMDVDIDWFVGDKKVEFYRDDHYEELLFHSLKIHAVTEEDENVYTCEAKRDDYVIKNQAKLTVLKTPQEHLFVKHKYRIQSFLDEPQMDTIMESNFSSAIENGERILFNKLRQISNIFIAYFPQTIPLKLNLKINFIIS